MNSAPADDIRGQSAYSAAIASTARTVMILTALVLPASASAMTFGIYARACRANGGEPVAGDVWRCVFNLPGPRPAMRAPRIRPSPEELAARRRKREQEAKQRAAARANERRFVSDTRLITAQLRELTRAARVQLPREAQRLAPAGSRLLGQPQPSVYPAVTLASQVGGVQTPASRIPTEDLRRATEILQTAGAALGQGEMSIEDQSYLANQAALAMEGAPLGVLVPEGRRPGRAAVEKTRSFVAAAQALSQARARTDQATERRIRAAVALARVNSQHEAGEGNMEELNKRHDRLLATFNAAVQAEAKSRAITEKAEKAVRGAGTEYVNITVDTSEDASPADQ